MGLDIHGWIEVTYASEGEAQDDTVILDTDTFNPWKPSLVDGSPLPARAGARDAPAVRPRS
jgi:hypothetical protein